MNIIELLIVNPVLLLLWATVSRLLLAKFVSGWEL